MSEVFVCKKCGSQDCEETAWVRVNTNEIVERKIIGSPADDIYCPVCQTADAELVTLEEFEKAKTLPEDRVVSVGTRVELVDVDEYGFLGRDFHPTKADIGFIGVIYKNILECRGHIAENVPAGTEFGSMPDVEDVALYWAISDQGKILQVLPWEARIA